MYINLYIYDMTYLFLTLINLRNEHYIEKFILKIFKNISSFYENVEHPKNNIYH
jgi:hypothetical protein